MIRALFLGELSLWTWVWQSTLFVLIGLAVSFILRRRPARACQGLLLAMVAAVLVPIMSVWVAHFGLGLLAPESIVSKPEIPEQVSAINYKVPAALLPTSIPIDIEPAEIQVALPSEKPVPVKATPQIASIRWRSVLLYGWMIAAFFLLGRLLVAFVSGVCLLRRAKSQGCERIQRAANSARARLGIRKDLRIRCGKNVRSPMIWCWSRRPILLVPKDLEENVDWVDVVCHELAHWRRRDHVSGLLVELAVCLLPWNPFLWWARKRVVRLSEQACDDWVLADGRAGTEYAQSLLNLSPKDQMAFLPTMIGKEKPMKERIYRIVKERYGEPRIGMRWALGMMIIAVTLMVGVAMAQRRPARFERDHESWREREERERREFSEYKAQLEDKAHELKIRMAELKRELERLEESGKGEGEEARELRAELHEMNDKMSRIEQEFHELEMKWRMHEVREPWEGREQHHDILRHLEELGHETALALRKLGEQQQGRGGESHALYRRLQELNEQMQEVREALRHQHRLNVREVEELEHPEVDRHMHELARHLEELEMNARDKERALHELEEQGNGETDDAHVIRRKLEEIHDRMHGIEEELKKTRMREDRGRYERMPAPKAMMREREELEEKAHNIELELRELGDAHPERAEMLEKKLHEVHNTIEQLEREPDRFTPPRVHPEEVPVRREYLRARLREIEHVLRELKEHGKGESEEAHNLGRELRALHEHLEAAERERRVEPERPRERERADLERQVEELRMQVNSVNEQMGEMRELLKRLLEESDLRERR